MILFSSSGLPHDLGSTRCFSFFLMEDSVVNVEFAKTL